MDFSLARSLLLRSAKDPMSCHFPPQKEGFYSGLLDKCTGVCERDVEERCGPFLFLFCKTPIACKTSSGWEDVILKAQFRSFSLELIHLSPFLLLSPGSLSRLGISQTHPPHCHGDSW